MTDIIRMSIESQRTEDPRRSILVETFISQGRLQGLCLEDCTTGTELTTDLQEGSRVWKHYLCMTGLVAKIDYSIFPPPPTPPPQLSSDPIALQSMLRGESGSHGSEDEADRRSRITNALEKSLECPITMERMVDPVLW